MKFKHYRRACTTKWKEVIDIVCKTTKENHRGPTPGESAIELHL